jgi:hypothetical protein
MASASVLLSPSAPVAARLKEVSRAAVASLREPTIGSEPPVPTEPKAAQEPRVNV